MEQTKPGQPLRLGILDGDGIGPEVVGSARRVVDEAIAPDIDLVIVRENSEGFYADRNMAVGSGEFCPTRIPRSPSDW